MIGKILKNLILICFLFTSCVLAEKFTCEIEVEDANHYSVHLLINSRLK
jgi:hypothetical protein